MGLWFRSGPGESFRLIMRVAVLMLFGTEMASAQEASNAVPRQTVRAIYVPLADHYAGIVAYEKYRDQMVHAEYRIERMKSWPLLRAYFLSGEADVAFTVSPLAMDMFRESPTFRWVSLMHRDGNALAVNETLNYKIRLPARRLNRKPGDAVADAFALSKQKRGAPIECGVPHLLSTHTVILYKYLRDHGMTLGLGVEDDCDVMAVEVDPALSPIFIKKKSSRNLPACFEQSLPWADVVETEGFGYVAWYSKGVLPWPNGHVDGIAIATDECIENKTDALREVIYYIQKAGIDIERARVEGGEAMTPIVEMIQKHIPEHNAEAIIQSLRADLNVINYRALNVDKGGLKQVMDLAVEGGILRQAIDIDAFADEQFATDLVAPAPADDPNRIGAAQQITDATKAEIAEKTALLEQIAACPEVIAAVTAQNAEAVSLDKIKQLDAEWIEGRQKDLKQMIRTNAVSAFLSARLQADHPEHTEVFLSDRQGALVGASPLTSDYWQGDEKHFAACFNNGNGQVFVSALKFDVSSSMYSLKIAVPVKDGAVTIGVLTLGLLNQE